MTGAVSDEELTEAILLASRAMVAVAVRSLAATNEDVTLPQYRTLVVLAYGGPKRLADLAANLEVSPSTATRMCDRLVRKELITRERDAIDRREVNLGVTDKGRRLIHDVMERRRLEVRPMLRSIPNEARHQLASSLDLLVHAMGGEPPDMHWSPGWHDDSAEGATQVAQRRISSASGS